MGGRLARGRRRLRPFLLQHDPDAGRRHPRGGPAHRPAPRLAGPCRPRRPGQARRGADRRRRHGLLRGADLGLPEGAGVPGPEQGPADDRRGLAHRRGHGARCLRSLARRRAVAGSPPARLGRRARRRAAAPPRREGRRSASRRRASCACPASSPIAPTTRRRARSSSSSRAIPPAARPSRPATARARPILPLRGKILNVASATRDKLAANQQLADLTQALGCGTGARYSTMPSCATTRSSS